MVGAFSAKIVYLGLGATIRNAVTFIKMFSFRAFSLSRIVCWNTLTVDHNEVVPNAIYTGTCKWLENIALRTHIIANSKMSELTLAARVVNETDSISELIAFQAPKTLISALIFVDAGQNAVSLNIFMSTALEY